jgi:hypothetical protein
MAYFSWSVIATDGVWRPAMRGECSLTGTRGGSTTASTSTAPDVVLIEKGEVGMGKGGECIIVVGLRGARKISFSGENDGR